MGASKLLEAFPDLGTLIMFDPILNLTTVDEAQGQPVVASPILVSLTILEFPP